MKTIYILANGFVFLTGGDRHFIEIAKRWQKINGVRVYLMIPKSAEDICNKEDLYADCLIIPPRDIIRFGIVITYILRTLFAFFKIHSFEKDAIVYSTSDTLTDVLPALLFKLLYRNSKWVSCSFHLVSHYSKRQGSKIKNFLSYYAQRLSIVFMKLADLLIVDNDVLKNELGKLGLYGNKIFVSSMGVDKEYIDKIGVVNKVYDACFVGRLHPSKGIFDLIKIWNGVLQKKNDARLAVVGKGDKDIVDELKNRLREYRLDNNINLLGFLEQADMYKIMKSSRIFVFPSHEEGWGIAIAEAMACGLPVIMYDLPALQEIFPQGVVRVKFGDIDTFTVDVLSVLQDDEKHKKLKLEAIKLVSNYSWDNVAMKEWSKICEVCN